MGLLVRLCQGLYLSGLLRRETLELVRAYYGITDVRLRRRLYEMAKAMRG